MRGWLQRLFAPAKLAPIVVRGRHEGGELPHRIEAQVTWLPSLTTRTYSGAGAQGMCLVPWYGHSSQAIVEVHADGARGQVVVQAGQTTFGRAFDVALASPSLPQASVFSG